MCCGGIYPDVWASGHKKKAEKNSVPVNKTSDPEASSQHHEPQGGN